MFGLMITMNYLANSLPLNGKTTGQLSAQYPNLFVPAGITFSIWAIIYLMLLGFIAWQFREASRPIVSAIGWAFAISSFFNALWIIAWHFEFPGLSLLVMLVILAALVYINLAIRDQNAVFAKVTFGVYLGWICVAIIANATALLVSINWSGWGLSDQTWAFIMILAALAITGVVLLKLQNPFIGFAVMWAFLGIVINRLGSHPALVAIGIIAMAIMLGITIWGFLRIPGQISS